MSTQSRRAKQLAALGGGALIAAPMLGGGIAHASTIEVTNLNDSGAGSLRDAIDQANTASGTADTITFAAGLSGSIVLTTGRLEISDDTSIVGPGVGVIVVDGNASSAVLYVYSASDQLDVTISGLTLTNGDSGSTAGGAIANWEHLTLTSVHVLNSVTTDHGGGIYVDDADDGALTLVNCIVSGNSASYGGGIAFYTGTSGDSLVVRDSTVMSNVAEFKGGGIYLADGAPSALIERSTISGNSAGSAGGGVLVRTNDAGVTVEILNTTISGNSADGAGGGVFLYGSNGEAADMLIAHSTITGNNSATNGGGVYLYWQPAMLDHTVVSGNTSDLPGNDVYMHEGELVADWSMIGDLDGQVVTGTNMLAEGDAKLGVLVNNGGSTLTHNPLADSPLINAGDPAHDATPPTDQRGLTRISGGRIDVGAAEWVPAPVIPETGSPSGTLAALGAALLAMGGALRLTDRRRSKTL